jgi:hypothetical protein
MILTIIGLAKQGQKEGYDLPFICEFDKKGCILQQTGELDEICSYSSSSKCMISNNNICYIESDSNPESFPPEDECKSYEIHGKNNLCEFRNDSDGVRSCIYKERAYYNNAVEYPSLIYFFFYYY